jgi:hypothetical protein
MGDIWPVCGAFCYNDSQAVMLRILGNKRAYFKKPSIILIVKLNIAS